MAEKIKIERELLSSEVIEQIYSAEKPSVEMKKIFAKEDLLFEKISFLSFEVGNSNFNDASLTFRDCVFLGSVALKEVKVNKSISFINCEFKGGITLFKVSTDLSLSLIGCHINGHVLINGLVGKKLEINESSAADFSVAAHEVPTAIKEIDLVNVNISSQLLIDSIGNNEGVNLENCNASILLIRNMEWQDKNLLNIEKGRIAEIIFEQLKTNHTEILLNSTTSESIYVRNCSFEESDIKFDQVFVNGIFAIKHSSYTKSRIDISTVTCENINLDQKLLDFINSRTNNESAIFHTTFGDESRLQTLKLLKDKFAREHNYIFEDNTFYLLKNFEMWHAIKSCRWWQLPKLFFIYFFSRFIMGWGVRLRNSFFSAILIIFLYSSVYYLKLSLCKVDSSIEYLGQKAEGFYATLVYSSLTFFGQNGDVEISCSLPIFLTLSEFIIGIGMVTIIVGMLIRKLVR